MTHLAPGTNCVLTLSCPEAIGIVHEVSGYILYHRCTVVESQQFSDIDTDTFFMRVQFADASGAPLSLEDLRRDFEPIAARYGMSWSMVDASERRRVVIMVSKEGHCLNDLLFRNATGELNLDIIAIVSNHPDFERLASGYDIPFRLIPVTRETKPQAEDALLTLIDAERVDLVVMARYMQILSAELCERMAGKIINIHHSMLPSFKGAKPYHQAHARGVKLIGATAHYATADLDEGPIIEQVHERVDHAMSADDFAVHGRQVEARALARAVRLHTENRVVLNGTRTVVLT
jgi:formyltetrahydrofolate deformylase